MSNIIRFLIAIIGCELVGILSTPFTISSIQTWYYALNKPFFSPPNWLFGPVWTLLYFFMGVSSYLIWKKGLKKKEVRIALIIFLFQLFLNFIWSFIFFGLKSPLLALVEIIILWLVIILTIIRFYKISKIAAYLLMPYILWVSFAAILNFYIWFLNR